MVPTIYLLLAMIAQGLTLAPGSPAPNEGPRDRLHLLEETLRVPFGEDWGGETHLGVRFDRLGVGLFLRAWSEGICNRADCPDRAVQAGAEVKINVAPALDVGLDVGGYKGATQRAGTLILPRMRLKF